MRDKEISLLLQKADELKALFILGQRVIPFLEEIFIFVRDITPLLDEINSSIEDNLKKMPKASKQLSKVTEATEMATTEIMDIIDGIVYKIDIISGNFKKLQDLEYKSLTGPFALIDLINKAIKNEAPIEAVLPEIAKAIEELRNSERPEAEFDEVVKGSLQMLNSIRDDSNGIMMSLQVQDITSQQIAAVNHLLEAVQGKLSEILNHFRNTEIGELLEAKTSVTRTSKPNVSTLHRNIAFDPDAVDAFSNTTNRRQTVDQIISDSKSGNLDINEPASQDDIDALFSGGGASANIATNEPASQNDIDALFAGAGVSAEDVSEPASQDDINALFAANNAPAAKDEDLTEPFSQDDIDALFNN